MQPEPVNISMCNYLDTGDQIVQVSCGTWHSVALSQYGRILTWGKNLHGLLGVGNKDCLSLAVPQVLVSLVCVRIPSYSYAAYYRCFHSRLFHPYLHWVSMRSQLVGIFPSLFKIAISRDEKPFRV